MSDGVTSKNLLKRYSIARIPFISIQTIERDRTLEITKEVAIELESLFFVHSLSKGVYDITTGQSVSNDKSLYGAIDFISEQMRRREYISVLFTEIPDLSSESEISHQLLDLVSLANESGGIIMVMTHTPIWNQLQRLGMTVQIDLPNEDEMYLIIKESINSYLPGVHIEWDEADIREAGLLLSGVTKIEAENVIAALAANKRILKSDMDEVRYAKNRMFSDISGLEKINLNDNKISVGGLSGLCKWLEEKKTLLNPENRCEMRKKGLQPPRGILLVGVPGCGKSLSAKLIASLWKLPLYRLDFATVQGRFVGQSEQQLKDALTTAENVSPCILWIDEIEKGLAGSINTNDGGVSTRLVGQFLFWLQECKKQVFVVATANEISMLPPELLRRGRFDEIFFVNLPTSDERREILKMYMARYLSVDFVGSLADKIVEISNGFTGADLESTVREIAYCQIASKNFVLSEENIMNVFNNVIPLSKTSPERIKAIQEWGKEHAVSASGLK